MAKFTHKLIICSLMLCCWMGNAMAQSDPLYVIKRRTDAGSNEVHYLSRVKTGTTWTVQDATEFSPDCLWFSGNTIDISGTNHNYYFIDGSDYHFLSAQLVAGGGLALSDTLPPTQLLRNKEQIYYFYDWDWDNKPYDGAGVARGYQYVTVTTSEACDQCGGSWDSDDNECWKVLWVECDGSTWKLSSTSNYHITENSARFRLVTVTETHTTVSGGIESINVDGQAATNFEMSATNESHSLSATIDPTYNYIGYTTYLFESTPHYYYNGQDHSSAPTSTTGTASSVASRKWTITGPGAAHLSFDEGSNQLTSASASPVIYYRTPNPDGHKTATLTLTVTYNDGSQQEKTATVLVKTPCQNPKVTDSLVSFDAFTATWVNTSNQYTFSWKADTTGASWIDTVLHNTNTFTITGLGYELNYDYKIKAECTPATSTPLTHHFTTPKEPDLVIYGSVFGGGRMADVHGKTKIDIINCDSIGAVFGGNDIAGSVDSATITLGDNTSTKVRVHDVYGGGNGYYAYNGSSFAAAVVNTTTVAAGASVTALSPSQQWTDTVWSNPTSRDTVLTLPSIIKTAVVVSNNTVKIDSLFGGAKNAFLKANSGNGDSICINGGTILAVFGGNNLGGSQGYGKHFIKVNQTTTRLDDSIVNGANSGYGRDFGIRYLYGGGNKVAGSTTQVIIAGGQCDTVFAGGNSADVFAANIQVNCPIGTGSQNTFGSVYSNAIANYSATDGITIDDDYVWNGFGGIYNVRTLFGGNNEAPMLCIPTVKLTSGSIGTVYGGGNAGDMLAFDTTSHIISDTLVKYSTHVEMNSPSLIIDYLYGGCQISNVDYSTWVEIKDGHVGTVYGGCNVSGDVGSTKVNPENQNIRTWEYQAVQGAPYVKASGGIVYKNLFAGSNGFYHCNDGINYIASAINYGDPDNIYVGLPIPTHNETYAIVNPGATIKGNVYAGGNLACVGFTNLTVGNLTTGFKPYPQFVGLASVRMSGGTVEGDVYGGGNMAAIYGSNEVRVSGGIIHGALYGGNDRLGMVAQITNRVLPPEYDKASDGETSLAAVKTYLSITGKPDIETVYGGGNGDYDYVNGDIQYCNADDQPIQSHTFVDINLDGFEENGVQGGHINTVYGGGNGVTVTGSTTVFLNVKGQNGQSPAEYDHVRTIFGGNNKGNLEILTDVILLNGRVNTIYGGCNQGKMLKDSTFSINGTTYAHISSIVHLRDTYLNHPTQGKATGAVYGGCRMNDVNVNSLVLVEGGNHTADIFGGSDISGQVGGTSKVIVNGGTVGNVYGGGNGNYYYDGNKVYDINDHTKLIDSIDSGTVTAPICAISQVEIMKGNVGTGIAANEKADVFGGGLGAGTSTLGDVTVTIGTDTVSDAAYCPTVYGDVYGGSALGSVNTDATNTTTVDIINGTVRGNVYGGGLGYAEVNSTTGYLVPNSTETPIEAIVNGTVHVNIGDATLSADPIYENFVNVNKVFGGNNLAGSPQAKVYVDVYRTAHTSGNAYPSPEPNPDTISNAYYNNHAYAINEVYGGGNLANYSPVSNDTSTYVHIHNCDNTIGYVYGGGNAARVPASKVIIDGGLFNYVFGGGNGYGDGNPGANVSDNDTIVLNGGLIGYVYGGSNARGTVYGETSLQFKETPDCNRSVNELYGGGNQAADADGITLNIPCGTSGVKVIYGGANQANVGTSEAPANVVLNVNGGQLDAIYGGNNQGGTIFGKVVVNLYGGTIDKVFGGNNQGGLINDTIQVNVMDAEDQYCPLNVNTIYGGGNMAAYTPTFTPASDSLRMVPQVNVIHGTINDAVYGGGMGSGATVNANPVVTIGDNDASHKAIVGAMLIDNSGQGDGNVYGGGDAAAVNGSTTVIYQDNHDDSQVNRLFGGGNQADAGGATVNMNSGKVLTGIYGGCNTKGNVSGDIVVNINGGTLGTSETDIIKIFGGGYGGYDDAAHPGTSTSGNVTVNIGDGTTTPTIYGNVHGGSAFGSVNDNNGDVTTVHLQSGTVNGRVYGGGLGQKAASGVNAYEAAVNGGVQVLVDGGTVTHAVYGCNDQNGAPQDTVNVKINGGNIANVIGGGNEAAYSAPTSTPNYPAVYITGGTVTNKVVGGGNAANIGTNAKPTNPHVNISGGTICTTTTNSGVYGGCNESGIVTGDITVNITGQATIGSEALSLTEEAPVNVHGGGYGAQTQTTGNVTVNFGTLAYDNSVPPVEIHQDYPKLFGDLYGGSAFGDVNDDANDKTTVNIYNGTVTCVSRTVNLGIHDTTYYYSGRIYGGGLGRKADDANGITAIAAKVYGEVHVNVGSYEIVQGSHGDSTVYHGKASLVDCEVYGCNNANGSPQQKVYVDVYQTTHVVKDSVNYLGDDATYAIKHVFGGGNEANYAPDSNDGTKKTYNRVHKCDNTIDYVYGGGNAADSYGTVVNVDGGRFNFIFGGGNGQVSPANILNGGVDITISSGYVGWYFNGCNMQGTVPEGSITELYGCTADCPCDDTLNVLNYYFGANQATIYVGLEHEIKCGDKMSFRNVYAGSRLAVVYGDIKLTVQGGIIGNLYGGNEGSQWISADVRKYPTDSTTVTDPELKSYLGRHPEKLGQGGNIYLTLQGGKLGNVYGGNNYRGNVEGNIYIEVDSLPGLDEQCRLDIDYIYGGSNLAGYYPLEADAISPVVNLKRGHVNYDVFGGSKGGAVSHNFGNGRAISNPKVIIGDEKNTYITRVGRDVFGGGSAGAVQGNTKVILQGKTTVGGDVYGGCKRSDVSGSTEVILAPTNSKSDQDK